MQYNYGDLQIGFVLHQFLRGTVKQSNVRVSTFYRLSIKL